MHHISSSDFKSQLGEYLALSREAPILVERSGKPVAVVMSPVEYEHLQKLEDLYWIARAQAAEDCGEWVSHEEAVRLLSERLQRPQ